MGLWLGLGVIQAIQLLVQYILPFLRRKTQKNETRGNRLKEPIKVSTWNSWELCGGFYFFQKKSLRDIKSQSKTCTDSSRSQFIMRYQFSSWLFFILYLTLLLIKTFWKQLLLNVKWCLQNIQLFCVRNPLKRQTVTQIIIKLRKRQQLKYILYTYILY